MSDFLESLGQSARTKDEALSQVEREHVEKMAEMIVEGIKKDIFAKAKSGQFETKNGKRTIAGKASPYTIDSAPFKLKFISVCKRLTWPRRILYLISGLATCGFAPLIWHSQSANDSDYDVQVIIAGEARLTTPSQKAIQMAERILKKEGISVTGIEVDWVEGKRISVAIANASDSFFIKYSKDLWLVNHDKQHYKTKIQSGYIQEIGCKLSYTVTF